MSDQGRWPKRRAATRDECIQCLAMTRVERLVAGVWLRTCQRHRDLSDAEAVLRIGRGD